VIPTMQPDLFHSGTDPVPQAAGLFVDVVFDRPLDHAFTYAVGDELRAKIGIGKHVRAPFGRGDKPTIGYCVRVSDTAPERAVKAISRVLDAEALLDRVIKLASDPGDLVADFFCGSGTTAMVAEKLNRCWVACDLGRFAIQTTRKRLLSIDDVRPFAVQNLGGVAVDQDRSTVA